MCRFQYNTYGIGCNNLRVESCYGSQCHHGCNRNRQSRYDNNLYGYRYFRNRMHGNYYRYGYSKSVAAYKRECVGTLCMSWIFEYTDSNGRYYIRMVPGYRTKCNHRSECNSNSNYNNYLYCNRYYFGL